MNDIQKSTHHDAELILRLYELRREPEMRKARNWFGAQFWPNSFEELQSAMMNFEAPENAWFRQVTSYWDMAAALVNRGALDAGLFYDTCGEGWVVWTKLKPFVAQMRAAFGSPEVLAQLEKVTEGTPAARERVARLQQNLAKWAEMRARQRSAKGA